MKKTVIKKRFHLNKLDFLQSLLEEIEALKNKNYEMATKLASLDTLAEQLNVQISLAKETQEKLEKDKHTLQDELRQSRDVNESLRTEIQELLNTNCKIWLLF